MKIAAISDIHGNIYSLMKVLEDIDEQKVDLVICLGDLVGYGPHPNEVIALIKR
ncbi:metallophosphoesterase family protein, partial [Clostridium tertium]